MSCREFLTFVYASSQLTNAELPIAATRAGGVGVVNAELETDNEHIFACLDRMEHPKGGAKGSYGLKLGGVTPRLLERLAPYFAANLTWLILDSQTMDYLTSLKFTKYPTLKLLVECIASDIPDCIKKEYVDGVIIKGNESGGYVGEESSFILLQKWAKQTRLPLYIHGGVTPHVAAACHALGVAGGVLDSQVLLLRDSPVAVNLQKLIAPLSGSETVAVGDGEKGYYFRVLNRPQLKAAGKFIVDGEGLISESLRKLVASHDINWHDPKQGLLPVGHDICFAEPWRKQYGTLATLIQAINHAVDSYAEKVAAHPPLSAGSPLAQSLGTTYPIIQGPMTRVSDTAPFAQAIAAGGALPMLAFALLRNKQINELLEETKQLLADKPWGIGLLGFVPPALLEEQINAALPFKPNYAIIAGGRPDQAVALEVQGIPSFLHLPSANLLANFLKGGARRFIFEGRECGGHIGPLSSFVLWSAMIDRLLVGLDECGVNGEDVQCLFAGGIHDEYSSALVQVMVAPLLEKNVNIGILMGSAYLFTKEIVEGGAIVEQFQKVVVSCDKTVNLESGTGHASRCAYTPFAETFFKTRKAYKTQSDLPADEIRGKLDDLILGTLRMASKGVTRKGEKGDLVTVDTSEQQQGGMYMLGQVVPLRKEVITVSQLHAQVTEGARQLLEDAAAVIAERKSEARSNTPERPADIAIIGMNCALPGAKDTQSYWQNILDKVDSITEVPQHRWDWRLYFDENRHAKDKIYSKWGGFIDDMPFNPMDYGITPKSIESVDTMQLMALQVARAALDDAGFQDSNAAQRMRTSVIVGASGGAGDVGMQYGLRSELPRFLGELPENVAQQLPEWTEDTFAGILINVVPGRIANRLNLGGVNFTTDAACASSLTAVYQAVSELQNRHSDVVIAGGADTVQGPFGYMCFSQTQALSPRGKCRTFDESGDGIVISEGIVMLVLKRLEDAERDGDRVYAVIKGVGGGSDGKAKGLSAPEPEGQLRAMRRAYQQAGFLPNTVTLFEAHGTGTVAGDTAELESTSNLVKESGGKPRQAVVGSVKTMIGHTKATAGIAGLMKAALALHYKVLPPHRGVETPNKKLTDSTAPLYLLDKAEPWLNAENHPRRAAASAFGFGGTNFHVVLEEYQGEYRAWKRQASSSKWPAELFVLSGTTWQELNEKLAKTQSLLAGKPDVELRDLALALAKLWNADGESISIVASSFEQLIQAMAKMSDYLVDGVTALLPGTYYSGKQTSGKLAVLFPGQGSQYTGMTGDLAIQFPVCSDTLSSADKHLSVPFGTRFGTGTHLSHFIFPRGAYDQQAKDNAARALTSTDVAQAALGAVEAGLWELMAEFGLKADMLAGHSYGEFVALYAAGRFSFDDLMAVSEARGRLIVDKAKEAGSELGTMAAVKATRTEVESAIKGIDGVIVANHNAPKQVIISGSAQAVNEASAMLTQLGKSVTPLPVAAAFHSSFVEPARASLAEVINDMDWKDGKDVAVYSNNTAKPHHPDLQQLKKTMADHLVNPVEFVAEIEAMYQDGARVFLELGPKTVLTKLVGSILGDRPHTAIAIDGKGRGTTDLLHAFGQLLCAGVALDIMKLFEGRECLDVDINSIAKAQRHPAIPKHAWMLNGSRARRVGEDVKNVGITVEQIQEQSQISLKQEVVPEKAAESTVSSVRVHEKCLVSTHINHQFKTSTRERVSMKSKETEGEYSVTRAYFELVSQQLDNARDVMLAELGVSQASFGQQRSVAAVAASAPRQVAPLPRAVALPAERAVEAIATPAILPQKVQVAPKVVAPQPVSIPTTVVELGGVKVKFAGPDSASTMDKEALKTIMLDVVTDKTGYEADMIDLQQNLEADLGVDSIKRVEIVGGVLEKLPDSYVKALGDSGRTKLSTATTLDKMLTLLLEAGETSVNFNHAEVGFNMADIPVRHSPRLSESRFEMVSAAELMPRSAAKHLTKGDFIVTQDSGAVAEHVVKLLPKDCAIHVVPADALENEASLLQWCASQSITSLGGIVHLAPLMASILARNTSPEIWRSQIFASEKSLFLLVKHFSDTLSANAHVLSASALGGFFGRKASNQQGLSLQGGAVGLIKSLCKEREQLRGKAVDLDPQLSAEAQAAQIFGELEVQGGRIEVGYPQGMRTVFKTQSTHTETTPPEVTQQGLVVLATGGAKGVTAEVLRDVAKQGNSLILTGRSPLPAPAETLRDSDETSGLATEKELTRYFVKTQSLPLGDARKKANAVLSAREMLDNIADFKQSGASIEYYTVDVTNEVAMADMFANLYQKYGKIDGVVHGAGIIEDKFLADITSDSWSRVVDTKVIGLLLLQKYVQLESLQFFTVFSSVAGRYGNSGQSNYATANELMNRVCSQLKQQWKHVKVSALCWGPWGVTKFGTGMVTEATEEKFARQGVYLVNAELGRALFRQQWTISNASDPVEIICGMAPWEEHEAAKAAIIKQEIASLVDGESLLGHTALEVLPKGEITLNVTLGKQHLYLQDHIIDENPVLPMAIAIEMMVQAVSKGFGKGWTVSEVMNCQLFKGVTVDQEDYPLTITMAVASHASADEIKVKVKITSQGDKPTPHYGATVVLTSASLLPCEERPRMDLTATRPVTAGDAYDQWLFHGPRFQVIESINAISEQGAECVIHSTSPQDLLDNAAVGNWFLDPALVDGAAQLSVLWMSVFRELFALPVKFRRIVRYAESFPDTLVTDYVVVEEKPESVTVNVYFSNENGDVLMMIEGMQHIASVNHSVGLTAKKSIAA